MNLSLIKPLQRSSQTVSAPPDPVGIKKSLVENTSIHNPLVTQLGKNAARDRVVLKELGRLATSPDAGIRYRAKGVLAEIGDRIRNYDAKLQTAIQDLNKFNVGKVVVNDRVDFAAFDELSDFEQHFFLNLLLNMNLHLGDHTDLVQHVRQERPDMADVITSPDTSFLIKDLKARCDDDYEQSLQELKALPEDVREVSDQHVGTSESSKSGGVESPMVDNIQLEESRTGQSPSIGSPGIEWSTIEPRTIVTNSTTGLKIATIEPSREEFRSQSVEKPTESGFRSLLKKFGLGFIGNFFSSGREEPRPSVVSRTLQGFLEWWASRKDSTVR